MARENTDPWPRWPSACEHPLSLVDVRVKLNVDTLFELLYAPGSEYVVSETRFRGYSQYRTCATCPAWEKYRAGLLVLSRTHRAAGSSLEDRPRAN